MSTDRYFLNPFAAIFFPNKDEENNFSTIVFNPQTENILKVNRFSYEILVIVDNNPGLDLLELTSTVSNKRQTPEWQNESKIIDFIEKMVNENVIVKR